MSGSPIDDATLMTFAGIAYGAVENIPRYVQESPQISTDWAVVWTPAEDENPDNLAYIALDQSSGMAVLAIRGTYPNPFSPIYWENGQQDSPFGPMQAWPGGGNAKISNGTNTGFSNLIALVGANGLTIEETVAKLPQDVVLCVTGHSLGGTLAPVLALKLSKNDPSRSINITSFAGLTPGNKAFAELFASDTPLSGKVRRIYNTLDSVSYGWNNVLATRNFFFPNPQGGFLVKIFLLLAWLRLKLGGYNYAAIGQSEQLTGQVQDPSKTGPIAYVLETLHQHMPDTYLSILGAPPLPFSILFGNVTVDKGHAKERTPKRSTVPVFHT
ncbi:hypothetical protein P775_06660 [Puniceibacterium antarcticum]|uniref:Fungal lipase-type domain-containing protein n=1 Tax=Puniceibacterium antarcticum TaxID=1206336 RepID=A0A2G8RHI6_9RHOB|nr:lipase [Puniceibacterium antarcticum]PIL21045.1 hypothetical protein P775_06660 [Puniceibacterium antarcticum]